VEKSTITGMGSGRSILVLVLVDRVMMMGEVFALLHRMSRGARRGADVCCPFPSTRDSLLLSGLLPILNLVLVCSNGEFGRSTPEDLGLPKLVSLIRGRYQFAIDEVIQQATDEVNPIKATLVRRWYMARERVMQKALGSDSGVPYPALDVYPAF
jgi:hypothetical protein